MHRLFISDLHLCEERPDLLRAFLVFLEKQAAQADELYILGDFFEVWLGDDDSNPLIDSVTCALQTLSNSGIAIYLMHGNRDFLIGDRFCQLVGATLLKDPTVISLGDRPALLMHGDTLCTEDIDYLKFRSMVRNPDWQLQFLGQPLEQRYAIARQMREKSQQAAQNKSMEIMDVTQAEVDRVMTEHQVDLMIHGHTHRPNRHELSLDGKPAERVVLGDWGKTGWVLESSDQTLDLKEFLIAG